MPENELSHSVKFFLLSHLLFFYKKKKYGFRRFRWFRRFRGLLIHSLLITLITSLCGMTPRTLKQSDNGNFSCYRWIQIRCCIKFAYRKVASAIMNARICIRLFR